MLSLNFQNQMFMTEEILGNLAINLLWKTGKKRSSFRTLNRYGHGEKLVRIAVTVPFINLLLFFALKLASFIFMVLIIH